MTDSVHMISNKLEPLDSYNLNLAVQKLLTEQKPDTVTIYNSPKIVDNPTRIRFVYPVQTTTLDIDRIAKLLVHGFYTSLKQKTHKNASIVTHPTVEQRLAPTILGIEFSGNINAYFTKAKLENNTINAWIVANITYK